MRQVRAAGRGERQKTKEEEIMIGTVLLTLGALCVAGRAHYGSDNRWHWYKETPQQYRARKKREYRERVRKIRGY